MEVHYIIIAVFFCHLLSSCVQLRIHSIIYVCPVINIIKLVCENCCTRFVCYDLDHRLKSLGSWFCKMCFVSYFSIVKSAESVLLNCIQQHFVIIT